MKVPLQVTFRDIPPSAAVESRIREKVQKLHRFYDRITACRVGRGVFRARRGRVVVGDLAGEDGVAVCRSNGVRNRGAKSSIESYRI